MWEHSYNPKIKGSQIHFPQMNCGIEFQDDPWSS